MNAGFILKRYFVEGLAHASYLIGEGGEAAVVDPKRDVADYLADAHELGLRITAILETHPHADFISGHLELARRTGAEIHVSHRAGAKYPHHASVGGDKFRIGELELEAMETPGHSPDSMSWLVRHKKKPVLVFTGDTLFVGDVGRPDLRDAEARPDTLASALYDSLFGKLLKLPDGVQVHPAHGQGSLCGRSLGSAPFSTIGEEKRSNWALQIHDRPEFVRQMTTKLPDRPDYFSHAVKTNLKGAKSLGRQAEPVALNKTAFKAEAAKGAVVIDTRSSAHFGAGHFPGSLNIGIASHLFATWVGFFVPYGKTLVLVVEDAAAAAKAALGLARIGFDDVAGYILAARLGSTGKLAQITPCLLRRRLTAKKPPVLLDVRSQGEWSSGHLAQARHMPLSTLPAHVAELPRGSALALVCGSGYRSSIAASLLQRHGFTRLQNVKGGMEAVAEGKCPGLPPVELVSQPA